MDLHPRIVQQLAIHLGQELPVPCDHFGQQFRHIHDGIGPGQGEHPLEREAEPQPADQDPRPWRQMGAGKLRHLLLGRRGGGAHQLQAGDLEEMVAIVLVEA